MILIKKGIGKPRTRLCWICGEKFWGNKFTILTLEDGYERECHKRCAEEYKKEVEKDKCITIRSKEDDRTNKQR